MNKFYIIELLLWGLADVSKFTLSGMLHAKIYTLLFSEKKKVRPIQKEADINSVIYKSHINSQKW